MTIGQFYKEYWPLPDDKIEENTSQKRLLDKLKRLKEILLNEDKSNGKIFNIGNPFGNLSIKQVSELLVEKMKEFAATLVSIPNRV